MGELKKGRYVYYHCTGVKGKCEEPYTREEVLEEYFGLVLKRLYFDDEVMEWIADALKQSHGDEKKYHGEAMARLQTEYNKLQGRIDAMYLDKLDGKIDGAFFDGKAREWREEQERIQRTIEEHQDANQSYLEEGIRILELSRHAYGLFQKQEAREKRQLLNFLLSNCTWKNGELEVTYRQPFDMIVQMHREHEKKKAAHLPKSDLFENWLPKLLSQSVLLWTGMKLKMVRTAKWHTKIMTQRNLKPSEPWTGSPLPWRVKPARRRWTRGNGNRTSPQATTPILRPSLSRMTGPCWSRRVTMAIPRRRILPDSVR